METIQTFFTIGAQRGWCIHQLDVKMTFLNSELKEKVYVSQLEGFVNSGKEEQVYRLQRALYGLRQAPRAWYSCINEHFHQLGYVRSPNEPTVYTKYSGSSNIVLVCIYVDDIIYMSSSQEMLEEFKRSMTSTFEMSDLGPLRYFLGLEVK